MVTNEKMNWFVRTWVIEDESGEKEFIKKLFGTDEVYEAKEYVSVFKVINISSKYCHTTSPAL